MQLLGLEYFSRIKGDNLKNLFNKFLVQQVFQIVKSDTKEIDRFKEGDILDNKNVDLLKEVKETLKNVKKCETTGKSRGDKRKDKKSNKKKLTNLKVCGSDGVHG